jgi:hypothetical protein
MAKARPTKEMGLRIHSRNFAKPLACFAFPAGVSFVTHHRPFFGNMDLQIHFQAATV